MEDKILLTARYVENDLAEDERKDFEERLSLDISLQKHLADYHNLQSSLKIQFAESESDLAFKQTLSNTAGKYFKKETSTIKLGAYKKWFAAAAAILVVGLLFWAPWNKDLYTQFATTGQMLVTERGAAQQTDLDIAAGFFNEKKYVEAEKILKPEYTKNQSNSLIAYYYGITLIENDKLIEARKVLLKVYQGESAFKTDAAYNIALSYLKEKENEECKTWLEKIPSGDQNYEKAQKLIKKL